MNREIKILETQTVNDGEQLQVQSVSYQGSKPFGGIFTVTDLDSCVYANNATGKKMVQVCCQFGKDSADEDATLALELHDDSLESTGIVGGGVDVITRIDYA